MTSDLRGRLKDAPALQRVAERYARLGRPAGARPITRFAPSPTGELHLGHVVHALWAWGVAAVLDAVVLIRMEDHDQTRCTSAHEQSILDDLAWLGFEPESRSLLSLATHPSPFRQSDVPQVYADSFRVLADRTELYSCTCTRSLLGPPDAVGERRYRGTCRGRPLACEARHVVRAVVPEGEVCVDDLRLGPLVQQPQRDQGDVVVRDAMGQWSYQFCVVVDDLRHDINLIVRGEDLLSSTGRQLLLARLLGRTTPLVTVHHPLVLAPDGRKLSKRDQSETVRAMRGRGMRAAEVLERAWQVAGLGRAV
jgi:glutamyl/glutaminyl-tRNA synthetase